jgi:hypothetical protein
MAELKERLDGSGSFLGMDSFSDPQSLPANEYVAAMNVVSRGGIVQTRPGSRVLSCAPSHDNLQGLCFFQPTGGVPSLVLACDGRVYVAQAPFTNFTRLENIQFNPFSKYVSFATCLQSTDYDVNGVLYVLNAPRSILVMQDGETRAAYWDGSTARHLNPETSPSTPLWVTGAVLDENGSIFQNWSAPVTVSSGTFVTPVAYGTQRTRVVYLRSETIPTAPTDANGTGWSLEVPDDGTNQGYDETKIGLWMVWSNNRLWVSREGQVFASDIGNPLKFTESQYLNEARAFYLTDDCTGMVELTDQSGILVFTKDDATVIRSSITDRTQWLSTPDFQQVVLQKVGCVAPRSIVVQYGLIWWFSAKGITSLDAALRQNLTSRLQLQDQEVIASKSNCSPDLSMICGAFYENYLLMSVPSGDVWNRHTWVLDQDPFPATNAQVNSWNSWWSGWRPVEWARGIVDGNERLFFLSRDFDGKGRVWEGMLPERTDNGCPITCALQTREHNYGDMELKEFKMAETYLKEVYGSVAFMQAYSSTKGPWTRILTKQIEATAGQIYEDGVYGETGNKFTGNRPQSRTLRSSEGLVTEIPCQADCGVESGQEAKPANIDRAFSLLMVWSGRAGVYGYRIISMPVTDNYTTGRCEEDEVAPRSVARNGAAALSWFTSCNPFDSFAGSGSFSANNESCGGAQTFTAESSSIISQTDADNKAECAALTKAQCYADGQCGNPTFCNIEQTVTVSVDCGNGIRVCDGSIPVSVSCQSLSGSGELCGFSAYDDGAYDPASPSTWAGQYRKWRTETRSGAVGFYINRYGGGDAGIDTVNKIGYGGSRTFDGSCAPSNSCTSGTYFEQGAAPVTSWEDASVTLSASDCSYPGSDYISAYVKTLTSISGTAKPAAVDVNATTTYYSDFQFTLTEEQSLADSIVGGVVGTECISSVTYDGMTIPESTNPIGFTATTVVGTFGIGTVEVPLVPGNQYTATITLTKIPTGGGDPVIETVNIVFEAEAGQDEVEYEVPTEPGYDIQITNVEVTAGDVPCDGPVTASFTVPANAYCAASQVQADKLAYAYAIQQATASAQAELDCIYGNEEQSYTATCPGTLGDGVVIPAGAAIGNPVTITVSAGTYTATTQAESNALALADATSQANAALECFWTNTPQTAEYCCEFIPDRCAEATVPFNTYNSSISQNDADTLAYADALLQAEASIDCTSDVSDGGGEAIIL